MLAEELSILIAHIGALESIENGMRRPFFAIEEEIDRMRELFRRAARISKADGDFVARLSPSLVQIEEVGDLQAVIDERHPELLAHLIRLSVEESSLRFSGLTSIGQHIARKDIETGE